MAKSIYTPLNLPEDPEKQYEALGNWLSQNKANYDMLVRDINSPTITPEVAKYRDKIEADINLYRHYSGQLKKAKAERAKLASEYNKQADVALKHLQQVSPPPQTKGYETFTIKDKDGFATEIVERYPTKAKENLPFGSHGNTPYPWSLETVDGQNYMVRRTPIQRKDRYNPGIIDFTNWLVDEVNRSNAFQAGQNKLIADEQRGTVAYGLTKYFTQWDPNTFSGRFFNKIGEIGTGSMLMFSNLGIRVMGVLNSVMNMPLNEFWDGDRWSDWARRYDPEAQYRMQVAGRSLALSDNQPTTESGEPVRIPVAEQGLHGIMDIAWKVFEVTAIGGATSYIDPALVGTQAASLLSGVGYSAFPQVFAATSALDSYDATAGMLSIGKTNLSINDYVNILSKSAAAGVTAYLLAKPAPSGITRVGLTEQGVKDAVTSGIQKTMRKLLVDAGIRTPAKFASLGEVSALADVVIDMATGHADADAWTQYLSGSWDRALTNSITGLGYGMATSAKPLIQTYQLGRIQKQVQTMMKQYAGGKSTTAPYLNKQLEMLNEVIGHINDGRPGWAQETLNQIQAQTGKSFSELARNAKTYGRKLSGQKDISKNLKAIGKVWAYTAYVSDVVNLWAPPLPPLWQPPKLLADGTSSQGQALPATRTPGVPAVPGVAPSQGQPPSAVPPPKTPPSTPVPPAGAPPVKPQSEMTPEERAEATLLETLERRKANAAPVKPPAPAPQPGEKPKNLVKENINVNRGFHKIINDRTGTNKDLADTVKKTIIREITTETRKGTDLSPTEKITELTQQEWDILKAKISTGGKIDAANVSQELQLSIQRGIDEYNEQKNAAPAKEKPDLLTPEPPAPPSVINLPPPTATSAGKVEPPKPEPKEPAPRVVPPKTSAAPKPKAVIPKQPDTPKKIYTFKPPTEQAAINQELAELAALEEQGRKFVVTQDENGKRGRQSIADRKKELGAVLKKLNKPAPKKAVQKPKTPPAVGGQVNPDEYRLDELLAEKKAVDAAIAKYVERGKPIPDKLAADRIRLDKEIQSLAPAKPAEPPKQAGKPPTKPIGSFTKNEKNSVGDWVERKIDVYSISDPINIRGKMSGVNWMVEYTTISKLGKTGFATNKEYFSTKKEAISFIDNVTKNKPETKPAASKPATPAAPPTKPIAKYVGEYQTLPPSEVPKVWANLKRAANEKGAMQEIKDRFQAIDSLHKLVEQDPKTKVWKWKGEVSLQTGERRDPAAELVSRIDKLAVQADISSKRDRDLTPEEVSQTEEVLRVAMEGLPVTISRQTGLWKYGDNQFDVEPSFRVELNSTNPAEINQFVATLNALGRRFNQQAVTVYTYRGETKIEELGTKGRYGTIRPVLTIELKASLSADKQKVLLDKLSEVGISGASFSADGKTLSAYDMGDLDEESPKDENWYDSARRAVEVVKAEGIAQKAGTGNIELRVYTDVPRRNATATYEQGIRSAYSQEEGRTELETWHTPTRILPTEGVTGIERGKALFNNAMVKLGFEQEYIDTTINFQMDLAGSMMRLYPDGKFSDDDWYDLIQSVLVVDEDVTDLNIHDLMRRLVPDEATPEPAMQRADNGMELGDDTRPNYVRDWAEEANTKEAMEMAGVNDIKDMPPSLSQLWDAYRYRLRNREASEYSRDLIGGYLTQIANHEIPEIYGWDYIWIPEITQASLDFIKNWANEHPSPDDRSDFFNRLLKDSNSILPPEILGWMERNLSPTNEYSPILMLRQSACPLDTQRQLLSNENNPAIEQQLSLRQDISSLPPNAVFEYFWAFRQSLQSLTKNQRDYLLDKWKRQLYSDRDLDGAKILAYIGTEDSGELFLSRLLEYSPITMEEMEGVVDTDRAKAFGALNKAGAYTLRRMFYGHGDGKQIDPVKMVELFGKILAGGQGERRLYRGPLFCRFLDDMSDEYGERIFPALAQVYKEKIWSEDIGIYQTSRQFNWYSQFAEWLCSNTPIEDMPTLLHFIGAHKDGQDLSKALIILDDRGMNPPIIYPALLGDSLPPPDRAKEIGLRIMANDLPNDNLCSGLADSRAAVYSMLVADVLSPETVPARVIKTLVTFYDVYRASAVPEEILAKRNAFIDQALKVRGYSFAKAIISEAVGIINIEKAITPGMVEWVKATDEDTANELYETGVYRINNIINHQGDYDTHAVEMALYLQEIYNKRFVKMLQKEDLSLSLRDLNEGITSGSISMDDIKENTRQAVVSYRHKVANLALALQDMGLDYFNYQELNKALSGKFLGRNGKPVDKTQVMDILKGLLGDKEFMSFKGDPNRRMALSDIKDMVNANNEGMFFTPPSLRETGGGLQTFDGWDYAYSMFVGGAEESPVWMTLYQAQAQSLHPPGYAFVLWNSLGSGSPEGWTQVDDKTRYSLDKEGKKAAVITEVQSDTIQHDADLAILRQMEHDGKPPEEIERWRKQFAKIRRDYYKAILRHAIRDMYNRGFEEVYMIDSRSLNDPNLIGANYTTPVKDDHPRRLMHDELYGKIGYSFFWDDIAEIESRLNHPLQWYKDTLGEIYGDRATDMLVAGSRSEIDVADFLSLNWDLYKSARIMYDQRPVSDIGFEPEVQTITLVKSNGQEIDVTCRKFPQSQKDIIAWQRGGKVVRGLFYQLGSNGKMGVALTRDADESTVPHEFAHNYEKVLEKMAHRSTRAYVAYKEISDWLGVLPFQWTPEAREQFADGFMLMLYEGVSREGAVKDSYKEMGKILRKVWKDIRNLPQVELTERVRQIYEYIFETKTFEQVFPAHVKAIARMEKANVLANHTRGSPLVEIFSKTVGTSPMRATPLGGGVYNVVIPRKSGTSRFQVEGLADGSVVVDGVKCTTPSEVLGRVAQVVAANEPPAKYNAVFQIKDSGTKQTIDAEQKAIELHHLKAQKHQIALINSMRGKIDLYGLRKAMMEVIRDQIIFVYNLDPRKDVDSMREYLEAVKSHTGYERLDEVTTLGLMEALDSIDPGSREAYFGSDFMKLLPEIMDNLQKTMGHKDPASEEAMLRGLMEAIFTYPSSRTKASKFAKTWGRAANSLVATMGKEGLEVIRRFSKGNYRHDQMMVEGSEIVWEIKKIYSNAKHSNSLGQEYLLGRQKQAGRIIIDAIEQIPSEDGEGNPIDRAEVKAKQDEYILRAVQQHNDKALAGEKNTYEVNADDLIAIKDLSVRFMDYFLTKIDELNQEMGESVIGRTKNYFMRMLLGMPDTRNIRMVDDEGRYTKEMEELIRLGVPASAMPRTAIGEVAPRNTDISSLLSNYTSTMSKFIAYYAPVHYVNNELPLEISQNFNTGYEAHLKAYVNNIIGRHESSSDIDNFIRALRTNITAGALSVNVPIVMLNFMQRHLSSQFVDMSVWKSTKLIVNDFTGDVNKNKHPNLWRALDTLKVSGHSLYLESIDRYHQFDPDKTSWALLRKYLKLTKISEKVLEKSPFMASERPNWGFAYTAGILQSVMHSSKFEREYLRLLGEVNPATNKPYTKHDAKWQAVENALDDVKVWDNALAAGQIVNAAVNCDPSPVFSPLVYGKGNNIYNLLWFMRFFTNMVNIMAVEANPSITLKNNWSAGLFNSLLYGEGEMPTEANKLMILNTMAASMSVPNINKMFSQTEKLADNVDKAEAIAMAKTIRQLRDAYKDKLKGHKNYTRVVGGRLVVKNASALIAYILAEFLVNVLSSFIRGFMIDTVGRHVIPDDVADRKIKDFEKKRVAKSLANAGNIQRIFGAKVIATGMLPEVGWYQSHTLKGWARAFAKWTVKMNPITGVPDMMLRTLTGLSLEEIIYENYFGQHAGEK